MPKFIDLTGKVFGRLTVIEIAPKINNLIYWSCVCSCGAAKNIRSGNLLSGQSTSCGCVKVERLTTHGHYKTPTYNSWDNMIGRCYRPNANQYEDYGGRGITVCQRWRDSFENFLHDMGERPEGRTLDRVKVDGNYEPGNCVWSTNLEQQRNKRNSIKIPYDGELLSPVELAAKTGLHPATLIRRFHTVAADEVVNAVPRKKAIRPR